MALAATVIRNWVPKFVTDLRAVDAAIVFAAAAAMSIVASYVPVHRIDRIDPAMVFRT